MGVQPRMDIHCLSPKLKTTAKKLAEFGTRIIFNHGEAPVPGELATMSQRLPITLSPSSGLSRLVIKIVSVIAAVLIGCVWCYFTGEILEGKEEVLAPSSISPILLFLPSATLSFPSQLEWKIRLPGANIGPL